MNTQHFVLEEYESLEEKKKHFKDSEEINTKEELDKWIKWAESDTLKKDADKINYAFRGINEARFKNYSSLQRTWASHDLSISVEKPFDAICRILKRFKEEKYPLYRYLEALGVEYNDWLILSFLQHYGAASPLIDFSKDYKVALFFACQDVIYPSKGSNRDIDNYVSVYFYKTVDAGQGITTIRQIACNLYKDKDKRGNIIEYLSFREVMKNGMDVLILPIHKGANPIKTKNNKPICFMPIANMNSVMQKGEFVCNIHETAPLEDKFISNNRSYLVCRNIHKSLIPYIIYTYFNNSLESVKEQYFVQEEDIANKSHNMLLSLI